MAQLPVARPPVRFLEQIDQPIAQKVIVNLRGTQQPPAARRTSYRSDQAGLRVHPHPRRAGAGRQAGSCRRRPPSGPAQGPRRAPGAHRRRRNARLPAGNRVHPRRRLAVWMFDNLRDACEEKRRGSQQDLRDDAALIQQLVAETGANRPEMQKRSPQLRTIAKIRA